ISSRLATFCLISFFLVKFKENFGISATCASFIVKFLLQLRQIRSNSGFSNFSPHSRQTYQRPMFLYCPSRSSSPHFGQRFCMYLSLWSMYPHGICSVKLVLSTL